MVHVVRERCWAARHAARLEALCLAALALATALTFAGGSFDIAAARGFYRAGELDPWPLAQEFPWPLLYRAATWLTALLAVAAIAALGASRAAARRHLRPAAVLVLLALAIGPGLVGNVILKDHWRHPRPRDLVEFGGTQHYVSAPFIGTDGGASFPCGHCTVGFLYGAGWWVWKRRRPARAAVSLAAGILLGSILGVGRMAAGAHFLSDIIWSALLAFAVLHILYYYVLRVPQAEARRGAEPRAAAPGLSWRNVSAIAALFAAPHGTSLAARVPLGAPSGAPRILEVDADVANIELTLVDDPAAFVAIAGELHGFGLPGSRLAAQSEIVPGPPPRLRYEIRSRGWLTDVDGLARLTVPAAGFDRIIIVTGAGNIRVSDRTRAQVVRAQRVQLELRSARGRVRAP